MFKMFEKKCENCGKKISRDFEFCPFCGSQLKERKEYAREGLLDGDFEDMMGFGGMGMGMPFQGIMNKLVKELDKQLKDIDKNFDMKGAGKQRDMRDMREFQKQPAFSQGISISISSAGNGEPIVNIRNLGNKGAGREQFRENKESKEKLPKVHLTEKEAERISKLPKTEPSASVRRLADRIIYEIDLPGVNEKNIFINRLQNSIEIKAFTKDRAFFKLLPVSLPILRYCMEKGKLVLELKPEL